LIFQNSFSLANFRLHSWVERFPRCSVVIWFTTDQNPFLPRPRISSSGGNPDRASGESGSGIAAFIRVRRLTVSVPHSPKWRSKAVLVYDSNRMAANRSVIGHPLSRSSARRMLSRSFVFRFASCSSSCNRRTMMSMLDRDRLKRRAIARWPAKVFHRNSDSKY